MRTITLHEFDSYVRQLRPSNSLRRRLTAARLADIDEEIHAKRELFAVATKDGNAGILFIELGDQLYGTVYEISDIRDESTGRAKPIICDFCKTWQAGPRAGHVTFKTKRASSNAIGFLCCIDMQCSLHVRDMTDAAATSRSQLRENITTEQRIERLVRSLEALVDRLNLKPFDT